MPGQSTSMVKVCMVVLYICSRYPFTYGRALTVLISSGIFQCKRKFSALLHMLRFLVEQKWSSLGSTVFPSTEPPLPTIVQVHKDKYKKLKKKGRIKEANEELKLYQKTVTIGKVKGNPSLYQDSYYTMDQRRYYTVCITKKIYIHYHFGFIIVTYIHTHIHTHIHTYINGFIKRLFKSSRR